MPQFSFDYNIEDIVEFKWQNDQGNCGGTSRGVVKGILIGKDKAGYMIEHCNGTEYIDSSRVVRPVYSTKSFDVMYPGLEVEYRRFGDKYPENFLYAKIIYAIMKGGRLFYALEDCDGDKYLAPEGRVYLVDSDENKKNYR
ncbi:hypothetical protein JA33_132 [Dickeya phage vB_DsoM_JA33]|uniref:Uncharacterized protein n=2 Tax=Salmondvirus JA11 TaxID=2734141 RepID=A0A386K6M6_9CAUD|nr:hypothetical protein HOU32_gp132 [Dickeya phage vB_DsoM_JA11]AXG67506.1 hypothetical protein JA33_132 [Dickeya phage vB_DsoM_JA33]AYD79937.1 hypothetical protein JA11_132 [Dickeya phage vB_DsoM_JA11]